MLDIKRIRLNPQELTDTLNARNLKAPIDSLLSLDEQRRRLLAQIEEKKAFHNQIGKQIGVAKKNGSSPAEIESITQKMRNAGEEIAQLDSACAALSSTLDDMLRSLPNYLHKNVPFGATTSDQTEVHCYGAKRYFPWEPKTHQEIGRDLGIIYSLQSGEECLVYRAAGARLKRALSSFILDTAFHNGYEEIQPSYIKDREALKALGIFPDDNKNSFPLPHASVTLSALYSDKILEGRVLPLRNCIYSACVSSSAESQSGVWTQHFRHQSVCVEFLKITTPEQSEIELDMMLADIERLFQSLELPYRTALRCSGTTEFWAAQTYDIEVWMPSLKRYVRTAGCSDCGDFASRRTGTRFRFSPKDKPRHAHTLLGDAAVLEPTIAAILENYQNEDGTVTVPSVLVPLIGCELIK